MKLVPVFFCPAFISPKLAQTLKNFAQSCDFLIAAFGNSVCEAFNRNIKRQITGCSNCLCDMCQGDIDESDVVTRLSITRSGNILLIMAANCQLYP